MKSKKRVLKFNFIDVLAFCILVIIVFSFVYNFFLSDKGSFYSDNGRKNIAITIQTEPMENDKFKNLFSGQPVIDVDSGKTLGYVTEFSTVTNSQNENGENDFSYALIVLRCEAERTQDHYLINGEKVLLYNECNYASPQLFFAGSIISVSEYENAGQVKK